MSIRVLVLGLFLATLPALGCGWRARHAYRQPTPCCSPPPAVLLPATQVPVSAASPACGCPAPCACPAPCGCQ